MVFQWNQRGVAPSRSGGEVVQIRRRDGTSMQRRWLRYGIAVSIIIVVVGGFGSGSSTTTEEGGGGGFGGGAAVGTGEELFRHHALFVFDDVCIVKDRKDVVLGN